MQVYKKITIGYLWLTGNARFLIIHQVCIKYCQRTYILLEDKIISFTEMQFLLKQILVNE